MFLQQLQLYLFQSAKTTSCPYPLCFTKEFELSEPVLNHSGRFMPLCDWWEVE